MIHTVLAKQGGRHESSCTINVMCTEAQRKRIQAYVHEGREDKDQIYAQKGEGANLFAWRNKGQRPSLIMGYIIVTRGNFKY